MKMLRRLIFLILPPLFVLNSAGQDSVTFGPPLKIPMYLSGNFGEIRMDHFHSGIDIKTQGVTGQQVFSVEDGYVSRIKVQTNGYGKSIYIDHPNGYTSVYGHLDRYRDDIAAYVNKMQYQQKSQTVDLFLGRETFPLKKGDLIAYSGNTGGSSGPHLHFELRNTANQHPVNVLRYNLNIRDQVAPRFLSMRLYPMDGSSQINGKSEKLSFRIINDNGIYSVPSGTRLEGWGSLGISVEVFDFLNGASNRCGVYKLEMFVDNRLSYSYIMNEFSFSETRYVNAHADYEELFKSGIKTHRLYRLPNDRLRIYDRAAGNRPLEVDESREYPIRIVATDVAGNSSVLEFILNGKQRPVGSAAASAESSGDNIMHYNRDNNFAEGPVTINIPANSLYQDLDFRYDISPSADGSLTPIYHIASADVPLHSSYTLTVGSPEVDPRFHPKLLLVSYNNRGEPVAAGGHYDNGSVVASLLRFGRYAVALDTIAPEVRLLNRPKEDDFKGRKEMRFIITDNLSGIGKYEGYIDDKWALFEYDPKNNLLFYTFDRERISEESQHVLELYVSDERGNVNLLHTTFYW